MLEQYPADDRPQGRSSREAGTPDGDGRRALVLVVEHVADEREGRGRERGACHAEHRPRRNQHGWSRRERCASGGGGEGGRTDQEETPTADPVTQGTHRDER